MRTARLTDTPIVLTCVHPDYTQVYKLSLGQGRYRARCSGAFGDYGTIVRYGDAVTDGSVGVPIMAGEELVFDYDGYNGISWNANRTTKGVSLTLVLTREPDVCHV